MNQAKIDFQGKNFIQLLVQSSEIFVFLLFSHRNMCRTCITEIDTNIIEHNLDSLSNNAANPKKYFH